MSYEYRRHLMVVDQLEARGIKDERVLAAMEKVERHLFVGESLRDKAYNDCALPIGEGQTISQPYMVALMSELLELKGNEKVLEIGTGSGYQSAVLSLLVSEVFTVECIETLALEAKDLLEKTNCKNVHVNVSDGTLGLPEHAPYDGIIVTAGAPDVPGKYMEQLGAEGRLVIPVGSRYSQVLYQIKNAAGGSKKTLSTACVFVPLVGKEGWQ
jgi:protein-L-isoaspartate(D-aspartate) O-methyltransferase